MDSLPAWMQGSGVMQKMAVVDAVVQAPRNTVGRPGVKVPGSHGFTAPSLLSSAMELTVSTQPSRRMTQWAWASTQRQWVQRATAASSFGCHEPFQVCGGQLQVETKDRTQFVRQPSVARHARCLDERL